MGYMGTGRLRVFTSNKAPGRKFLETLKEELKRGGGGWGGVGGVGGLGGVFWGGLGGGFTSPAFLRSREGESIE